MLEDLNLKRIWLVLSAWWLFWMTTHAYLSNHYGLSFTFALIDSSINTLFLILTSIALFTILKFYRPTRGNIIYLRIWSIIHAYVITSLHALVIETTIDNPSLYAFVDFSSPLRFVYNLIMVGISLSIAFMHFAVKEMQEKQSIDMNTKQLAKDAELAQLRMQLQPHFLFNSLNSISALVVSNPGKARSMIHQLSDFLRGTIRRENVQMIPIEEECSHLDVYLQIEKVRFGDRLLTQFEISSESKQALVPALILQPVVENAIKFGLYDTTDEVLIHIIARSNANELVIQVSNPFDALTNIPQSGTGFGLTSIKRRLFLLYGRQDLLNTSFNNGLFVTTLIIPQS